MANWIPDGIIYTRQLVLSREESLPLFQWYLPPFVQVFSDIYGVLHFIAVKPKRGRI